MFQSNVETAQRSAVSEFADAGQCACFVPAENNIPHSPSGLRGIFRKCAMCMGSGAGGMLIGHAGCIVTPLTIMAVGATTATAGLHMASVGIGVVATSAALYAWHKLRGDKADKWEKRFVVGSALTGVLVSSALHIGNDHQSHKDFVPTSWCGKSPAPTIIHQPN